MSPPPFSRKIAENLLVKSARHCCLCQTHSQSGIEIHHIDQNGGNEEDNGIPLCFNCHSLVGTYNSNHPRGRKYRPSELKRRRDEVFSLVKKGILPKKKKITESKKRSLRKHSKHLLKTLYEYSNYSDIESMVVQIDSFLKYSAECRAYQNLWKHIETGYHDEFYLPLKRYQKLVIEYSTIDGNIPFYFGEITKEVQEEINSLQYTLGKIIGTLLEDVFENDLYLEGECPKCP